ncbi:prolactin-like [Peromyscus californicus insignis]|uniref:prolactin-like n=1 Tax=Peromyscus californicus insignis TaxID=564181 RepID=UPI0022A6FFB0|nr:prolactin-like [Peromyscus californicus insignis]
MQLSWSQPCSWMIQLLLVSNLLLWECVVSIPMCLDIEGCNKLFLQELFDHAIVIAQYTSNLTTQMSEEFDENFAKSLGYKARNSSICHTTSLATLEINEQIQQTQSDELLKVMISISRAWYHPLEHLVRAVAALKGTCETMLSKIKEVEEKNQELLEEMKRILVTVHPGAEENAYPAWMGLAEVRSANEDTHHFALSNLLHCLRSDNDKVVTYLEVVKCQVIHNNNC